MFRSVRVLVLLVLIIVAGCASHPKPALNIAEQPSLSAVSGDTRTAPLGHRPSNNAVSWYENGGTYVAAEATSKIGSGPYYAMGGNRFSWTNPLKDPLQRLAQDASGNLFFKGTLTHFQIVALVGGDPTNLNWVAIADDFEGVPGAYIVHEPEFAAHFVPVK